MKLTIPVYVEERKQAGAEEALVVARPLFFEAPAEVGSSLDRAIAKLLRILREMLRNMGQAADQRMLSRWSFSPEVDEEVVSFTLQLGQKRFPVSYLIVSFRAFDRRLAFSPSLPKQWFDLYRGESIFARAEEVITRYYRELAKQEPDGDVVPLGVGGARAWTTTVELRVDPSTTLAKPEDPLMALLGATEIRDGSVELAAVGRCLDWLYPHELERASGREREVDELGRLLNLPDRRPVLLVGPRLVGKTTLVHEHVYRSARSHGSGHKSKRNTWLISPQRLISGMSFVGQWENRVTAILKEAKKREHTLYFDDLVGLYAAGTHRDSTLSVAQVLKPHVERRDVRVLAEASPEQLRVLREIDRGFADLFHLLRVEEIDEDSTIGILIALERELERSTGCRFDVDALPTVIDLQRRFGRDAALPGKAAVFFKPLSVKRRKSAVTRGDVLEEFRARSGLSVAFLDHEIATDRESVIDALSKDIVGQPRALEAAADVVAVAKARLNDPERPLGTLLFLGPTGVGKTQTAKAVAKYLFGDEDRIVRFDMNEYVTHDAASRLVGTFARPDGLLTNAIRRQPFAVVLLDEIEKAHPDVLDLLLQLIGEGRLTDAHGRTADFTNAIVVMTSNLGVREAATQPGFVEAGTGSPYLRAAERFFRPEFFNRIDRIVPFERLGRDDVSRIARHVIGDVLGREGLARRRCALNLETAAMDRIVDEGFHPTLGARALKRAVERRLTTAVATRLATLRPEAPAVVRVSAIGKDIDVDVQALEEAPPRERTRFESLEPAEALARIEEALVRLGDRVDDARPDGPLEVGDVGPEQMRYFNAREQLQRAERMIDWALDRLSRRSKPAPAAQPSRSRVGWQNRNVWRQILAADDIRDYLKELGAEAQAPPYADVVADLAREVALLDAMLGAPADGSKVRLVLRSLDAADYDPRPAMVERYIYTFVDKLYLEAEQVDPASLPPSVSAISISGPHAAWVAMAEEGTHLALGSTSFHPIAISVHRGDSPVAVPMGYGPVVRVYAGSGAALDLRTGVGTDEEPTAHDLRTFVLSMLALPAELRD